ncbi:MAG: metallophosphoesterase, partial [Gammaproteobacteria bacterium]|nr:metallophosphoesterase [Gammaproteobacteria bacterium]
MAQEQNRYVKNKDKKAQFSSNNELLGSDSKIKKYIFSLKQANVSILSPSFLCPALKKPDEELRIIILADKLFFNTYSNSEGKDKTKAGPALSGVVNRYLKISPWSNIDKSSHASTPIFSSNSEAIENIEVHYLWNINDINNNTIIRKNSDKSEDVVYAQIHSSVSQMYKNENLIYGFEIILKNLPGNYNNEGLFNISWVNYKLNNEDKEDGLFFELQDQYINKFNKNYRIGYKSLSCDVSNHRNPEFSDNETVIESYHPVFISNKELLDIGHLSDVHVSSRQHLFSKSKAKLIDGEAESFTSEEIGQLVNTSYATLKDLMTQMGSDVDLLIFTGDLIDYNRNLNTNNSKISDGNIVKSSEIWKILNLDNLNNKELYPVGIDNLVMYELFKWYYSEFKKPIMLVSGNHEAYTLPYGISPRVKLSRSLKNTFFPGKHIYVCDPDGNITYDDEGFPVTKHVKLSEDEVIEKSTNEAAADLDEINKNQDPDIYFDRANEGIPADHNLTISEAILMYGPDYARVVMAAASDEGGERNFKPENLDWFYHIFTPLSSFVSFYNEQSFINLGWGDNEKFIGIKQGSWSLGGFLPRSTESVSDEQLAILKSGLNEKKSCNILCSHFTYANYNTPHPFSEAGEINYNDFISTLG